MARINFDAIPEELIVKEIFVTKGSSRKKLRIMGRGRQGVGMIRKSHVNIIVEKINCAEIAVRHSNPVVRAKWIHRQNIVSKLRSAPPTPVTVASP
jgi:hypothetical protein